MKKINQKELIEEIQRRFIYNGKATLKEGIIYPFSYPNLEIAECLLIRTEKNALSFIFSEKCPNNDILKEELGNLVREVLFSKYSWSIVEISSVLRINK